MSCLDFERNDSITIGRAAELGLSGSSSSFTISCWFFIKAFNQVDHTNNSGDNSILGMNRISDYCTLHLITRHRKLYFGFYYNDTEGTTILEEQRWYHAAFVYDAPNRVQRIYLNGKLDGEGADRGPLMGDFPVLLSSYAGGRGLNGRLANLRIWTAPLPREAICTIMLCSEDDDYQYDPRLCDYSDRAVIVRTEEYEKRIVDETIFDAMSRAADVIGVRTALTSNRKV
jgi:hypothetical protein